MIASSATTFQFWYAPLHCGFFQFFTVMYIYSIVGFCYRIESIDSVMYIARHFKICCTMPEYNLYHSGHLVSTTYIVEA